MLIRPIRDGPAGAHVLYRPDFDDEDVKEPHKNLHKNFGFSELLSTDTIGETWRFLCMVVYQELKDLIFLLKDPLNSTLS